MYETYERFWRQNVYFCLFDCSTIYCATIRVLSQCTLDVLQEVYYAQNIGLSQVLHVYLSDSNSIHRCDMYIRRITGTHVYLSDYRIDIYICQFSNNIVVHSSTHIFIELLNITWTILIRSNIYTVGLLLKIFLLQSLLMEVSEDIVMSDDNFL